MDWTQRTVGCFMLSLRHGKSEIPKSKTAHLYAEENKYQHHALENEEETCLLLEVINFLKIYSSLLKFSAFRILLGQGFTVIFTDIK